MDKKNYYDRAHMELYNASDRFLENREIKSLDLISRFPLSVGARLIDIGCGDGFFLEALADKLGGRYDYYGGEYSDYQREKAVKRGNFNIVHVDLEVGLEFDDSSFDFAYSGEVIEHLYNPDLMLKELNRVLKPGGGCLITTPNMNSWVSRVLFPFGFQPVNYECSTVSSAYGYRWLKRIKLQDWPVGHVRLFNKHSLSDMLRANGFELLEIKGGIFEYMPRQLRWLDALFSCFPSLASGLIVLARKI